jgi:NADH dehydrogenase
VAESLVERSGGAGRIVVPTRRPRFGRALQSLPTVELVAADVQDPAALARLLAGADAVIQLIAILHGSAAEFERVHVELPRRLVAACRSAGVRRIVHVSALGLASATPSDYLRSKAAGERILLDAGLDVTVLRPSVIFGARDRFTNLFAQLLALAPLLPLAGADARFQPVWVTDVAQAIVRCLDRPATIGQVIEAAGPQVLTLKQIVQAVGAAAGTQRPIIGLPGGIAILQARLMELLPGVPLMSRDNLRSMQVANVASGTLPGLKSLGITPTTLGAALPLWLGERHGPARLDRWRRAPHQSDPL